MDDKEKTGPESRLPVQEAIRQYRENCEAPWGRLFYQIVWTQTGPVRNCSILDYGSGFGITADHFAAENTVTAIEPNAEMRAMRCCEHNYTQLAGGLECLKCEPDEKYDYIFCHNVLEYVADKGALLQELCRVLKAGGMLSVVKHNHLGKVMQKVVFEGKAEEALSLLESRAAQSVYFGKIDEYGDDALETLAQGQLRIAEVFGVRTFFALQDNALKTKPGWAEEMLKLERAAEQIPEFRSIAFFHHVLLKKV